MSDRPSVLVFDVNETLSDLTGVEQAFAAIGAPPTLAATWFAGVLRDGFALTVAGASAPFADVARAGLRSLLHGADGFDGSADDAIDSIMASFMSLPTHPDVVPGIRRLVAAGHRLITLTNGSTAVPDRLLTAAGVRDAFTDLLSVEDAAAWKPDRRAYEYAAAHLGLPTGELMLVAVHPWDIDGAHRAGLRTAWIDRSGAPYPSVFAAPQWTVPGVAGLADRLG